MIVRRFLAFLLDILVLVVSLLLLHVILFFISGAMPMTFTGWEWYLWLLATVSLPIWCYCILLELWHPHATVGKHLTRLEVYSTSDMPINTSRAARRTATKLIPTWELFLAAVAFPGPFWQEGGGVTLFLFLLGLVFLLTNGAFLLFSGGHRTLHDLLSRTRVDRMPPRDILLK